MALSYLVDTSVLTGMRHRAVREVIDPRAERDELARAGGRHPSDVSRTGSRGEDAVWLPKSADAGRGADPDRLRKARSRPRTRSRAHRIEGQT